MGLMLEEKAKRIRDECRSRLQVIFDEARLEVERIRVIDKLLGDDTLGDLKSIPLLSPPEPSGSVTEEDDVPRRTTRRKATKATVKKEPRPKRRKRRNGDGSERPTWRQLIGDVLKDRNPLKLTAKEMEAELRSKGHGGLNMNSMRSELVKMSKDKIDWLEVSIDGRRKMYRYAGD